MRFGPGVAIVSALLTFMLAPGSVSTAGTTAAATVHVRDISFGPASVHIIQGDTVRWTWDSGTHSTTSGGCPGGICVSDGLWDSGIRSSGSFTHTFDTTGTFHYHCAVHGAMMQGTIFVSVPPPLSGQAAAVPTCGQIPLNAAFAGNAIGGQGPYSFDWDFGDGSPTSSDQSPIHMYSVAGLYTATLTVTDAALATSSAEVDIDASATPIAVINKVKSGNGAKLTITGTGFPADCAILINGQPAPSSSCKTPTKGKALGGAALAALLPLNQAVVITVKDTNTNEVSCPITFVRRQKSSSSNSGNPYP